MELSECGCLWPIEILRCLTISGEVSAVGNMAMIQIDSMIIMPHADNPLPRQVLMPDIYSSAKKCLHIPGAAIEDRQYQVDISGISLSTGETFYSQFIPSLEYQTSRAFGILRVLERLHRVGKFAKVRAE